MSKHKNQEQTLRDQKITKLEASRDDWKAKNKERYEEIKALKMRLKETKESRDRWKSDCNKAKDSLVRTKKIQTQKEAVIADLTKELENLKKKKPSS